MKKGAIFAIVLTVMGLVAVVFAFQSNSSRYVSVKEALVSQGESKLHLSGDIVPGTLDVSVSNRTMAFQLKDEEGAKMPVMYRGMPPANMGAATKVVAVGEVKDGVFTASDIITKCPSKYESEKK